MFRSAFALVLLGACALAQQDPAGGIVKSAGSISEPALPVIDNDACPFEGCTFRAWTVRQEAKLFSDWHDNRSEIGLLKAGEPVVGVTGVLVIRQPDRFLVRDPIPALSLQVGDVVLQYAEWGEGVADLWAKGEWHKNFDWGATRDGQLILTEDNLQLVRHGVKEWWVQVRRANGQAGWALGDGNFDGMDQLGDDPRSTKPAIRANSETAAEPQLPIFGESPCPGKGRVVPHWKVARPATFYSSWLEDRVESGDLWAGEEISVVGGEEVVRAPDRILITQPILDLLLDKDDVVLRFLVYGEGIADIWAKGEWHREYYLATTEGNAGCRNECDSVVIKKGTREWWFEVRTSSAQTGWVLGARAAGDDFWDSGNFEDLCVD